MKAIVRAAVLGAIGLALALPAEAQRAGSFSGRAGGSRGSSGARSSSTPRVVTRFQRNGPPAAPSTRWIARPISPTVIIVRPGTRPRPILRPVAPAFSTGVAPVRVAPRPIWIGRPAPAFGFHHFRRFHHFHGAFGFPFCSPIFGIGFATPHFGVFGRELVCFPRPFVSPFFFPFAPLAGSSVLLLPPSTVYAGTELANGEPSSGAYSVVPESLAPAEAAEAAEPAEKRVERPITLLQLKDGSMYGLTDYWLENGRLHYITSYGGENSLPIERIDLDKTVQLNWERGVEFVLRPKPARR